MRFKEFVKLMEIIDTAIPTGPVGALATQWTGTEPSDLPRRSGGWAGTDYNPQQFDLGIPSTTKTSQIRYINDKTNPIFIFLSDGTKLYLHPSAYRKITGEPKVGKMMTVVMQRRKDDVSLSPSDIQSIRVF